MKEYVEKNEILEDLWGGICESDILRSVRMAIVREISSIEGVDIVFCGDCIKRKQNGFCLEHNRYEKDDKGFCSYGKVED